MIFKSFDVNLWKLVFGGELPSSPPQLATNVASYFKTSIFQGFGAVGAQNFSPAALRRSNFGLNLMYLGISILRQIGVLKNAPPLLYPI